MSERLALVALVVLIAAVAAGTAGATAPTADQRTQCAAAQTLAGLGRDSDAEALYLALAKVGVPCKGATVALRPGWKSRVETFITDWSKVIGALAGAALLGVLLLASAFSLATHSRRARRALRHLWLVGRLLQPSVSVKDFDGSVGGANDGPATSALVGMGLRRICSEGKPSRVRTGRKLRRIRSDDQAVGLDVITGAESFGDTVAKLGDVAPQFKALGAILSFVTQTAAWPRYQLGGTLEPDGGHGPGMTLALDRRQRAADGTVLWRKPGTGENAENVLQQLALVAAGWTEWAVRNDEMPEGFDYQSKPRSYAYLRAGAVMEYLGHPEDAVDAYQEAVRQDSTNAGALANLGRIYGRGGRDADAESLLKAAVLALEPSS